MQKRPAERVAEKLWEIRRRLEGLRNDPTGPKPPPAYDFDDDHLVEGIGKPIERLLAAIRAAMAGAADLSPARAEQVVRILAHLRERLISVRDNASTAYGAKGPLGPSLKAAKMSMYRGMCAIWESHHATLSEIACDLEAHGTLGLGETRGQRAKNGAKQLRETQLRELEIVQAAFFEAGKRYPGLECLVVAWQESDTKSKRDPGRVATDGPVLLPPEYRSEPADQIRMWTHEPCGVDSLISEVHREHMDENEVERYEKECEEEVSWRKMTWLLRRKGETWDKEAALASMASLATRVMQYTQPWYKPLDLAYFDVLRELEVFAEGTSTDQEDGADWMDLTKWLWLLFLVNKEQKVYTAWSGGWGYGTYAESLPMCRKRHWPYAMKIEDVFLESTLLCGLLRQAHGYAESGTRAPAGGERERGTPEQRQAGKATTDDAQDETRNTFQEGPGQAGQMQATNLYARRFTIALSFPGEHRDFVEKAASCLAGQIGRERVLYDRYHEAEFARPDLDVYLPNLYATESELIVIFLCPDYAKKRWCKLEWRSVRQLISSSEDWRVMFVSFDDIGGVPELGISSGDGYVHIGARSPGEIVGLIMQRLKLNCQRGSHQ